MMLSPGLTSWEKILDVHPSLEEIRGLSQEKLVSIDGFAEKTAAHIVEGLSEKSKLIDELLAVGVEPQSYKTQNRAANCGI